MDNTKSTIERKIAERESQLKEELAARLVPLLPFLLLLLLRAIPVQTLALREPHVLCKPGLLSNVRFFPVTWQVCREIYRLCVFPSLYPSLFDRL